MGDDFDDGGEPSFDAFVSTSLPVLNRYAYALTGDIHASQDLVQDTLVRMVGAWRRVRRDGNPVGYARTVMFRTHISRWRRRRARPVCSPYQETVDPGNPYEGFDTWDELRLVLADMPALQRATIVLTYLDDLPDEEIAVLLERRPATIRSLRYRALRTMRERLDAIRTQEASVA